MDKNLITKTETIKLLEISAKSFNSLSIEPAMKKKNPHNKSLPMYLYDEAMILNLCGSKEILKYKKRKIQPKNYPEIFEKKYPNHKSALPIVCDCLFNLNRYAKYENCSKNNKNEIYSLKNELIEYLYENGYCNAVTEHIKEVSEKECFNCGGYGCDRCDYTGIYREGFKIIYYLFKFLINDIIYSWHQPAKSITFNIDLSNIEEQSMPTIDKKEVLLSKTKMKEAKELINWFLYKEI